MVNLVSIITTNIYLFEDFLKVASINHLSLVNLCIRAREGLSYGMNIIAIRVIDTFLNNLNMLAM